MRVIYSASFLSRIKSNSCWPHILCPEKHKNHNPNSEHPVWYVGTAPHLSKLQHQIMGFVCHVFNRIDCSKCIWNMVYGYNLSFVRKQFISAIINSPLSFMGLLLASRQFSRITFAKAQYYCGAPLRKLKLHRLVSKSNKSVGDQIYSKWFQSKSTSWANWALMWFWIFPREAS
jgi:hypothetical protein